MNQEILSITLQAGFAGVLVIYVWIVNRQFMTLVNVLDRHLAKLTELLGESLSDNRVTER